LLLLFFHCFKRILFTYNNWMYLKCMVCKFWSILSETTSVIKIMDVSLTWNVFSCPSYLPLKKKYYIYIYIYI
jgi:hypothetical protein